LIRREFDITYFAVEVLPEDGGAAWTVLRRYNDFHALNKRFRKHRLPGAPFPKKTFGRCAGGMLELRRVQLERWLRAALQHPQSGRAWAKLLFDFLQVGQRPQALPAAMPMPGTMPRALPAATPPPLPAPASNPPVHHGASEKTQEKLLLQIQVPSNVGPGQILGVTVPDGRQLNITVPPGLTAGRDLQLVWDAAHGTLAVDSAHAAADAWSEREAPVEDPCQVLQVLVPEGVQPGQAIEVVVPGGRRLQTVLPETARAGAELHLRFDPVAGTLKSIP
jgi:hypothetical protein